MQEVWGCSWPCHLISRAEICDKVLLLFVQVCNQSPYRGARGRCGSRATKAEDRTGSAFPTRRRRRRNNRHMQVCSAGRWPVDGGGAPDEPAACSGHASGPCPSLPLTGTSPTGASQRRLWLTGGTLLPVRIKTPFSCFRMCPLLTI